MKYFLLLLFCLAVKFADAQNKKIAAIHPLTIGDTVPEFTFRQVLNYPSRKARLSDFKGKIIILDMWSTYCSACIEAFPKMQALQDKFKDRIQVLLVNPYPAEDDPDERIKQVLARVKQRTGLTLTVPMPLHDTMLNHLFPHETVPHVVVINEKGIVIGSTYSWAVTPENIQALLAGEKIRFPVKNDWGFDKGTPLFVDGNGGDGSDFIYRSIITPYKDGIPAFIGNQELNEGKAKRFYVINYPLLTLYQLAYPEVLKYPANRTMIEVKDSSGFILYQDAEKDNKNSYCYEVIVPASLTEVKTYMQQDLQRTFHAVAFNEERNMKCYVLKKISNAVNVPLNTDSAGTDIETTSLHKYMHNQPLSRFIDMLNYMLPVPVIDATGLTKNISFNFPFDIYSYNIQQWNGFLSRYGLALEESERNMEVAVIKGQP